VPIFDSVLREMKLAKGENTSLWPGAKRDKFDEQRAAQHEERVPSVQSGRGACRAAEEAPAARPSTHLRRTVPRVRR
jgi:hypothetical protein